MSKRLRLFQTDEAYFVTQRCSEERFFLEPSPVVNAIIGAVLARAQEKYGVLIYAYIFMSNHFHLMVKTPNRNLDRFMAYFSGNLARQLNQHLGRHGDVWEDRYSAQVVLDEAAFQERIDYIEWNPVKAGLCRVPEEWCGLSSATQTDEEVHFSMLHKREWDRSSNRSEALKEKHIHEHVLRLSNFVKRIQAETMEFLHQDPFERPTKPKRSKAPLCFSSIAVLRALYASMYKDFCKAYARLSERFRNGDFGVEFPDGCFRPPHGTLVRLPSG